jgi:hypothetical protein
MLPSDRLPHLIARQDVAAWLADSVVTAITYHRTSYQAPAHIRASGVDPARSRVGSFGQGFYTSTVEEVEFGSVSIAVAVRLLSPLTGTFAAIEDLVDRIAARLNPRSGALTMAVAVGIRRELLRLGYDGIIVPDGGGDGVDWVIALSGDSVKVVDE